MILRVRNYAKSLSINSNDRQLCRSQLIAHKFNECEGGGEGEDDREKERGGRPCESEFCHYPPQVVLSASAAREELKARTKRNRKKRWPPRGCHEGAASLLALAEMGRCDIRVSSSSQ